MTRPRGILGFLLALTVVLGAAVFGASAAGAVTAPKRPHPHRAPWPVTLTVRTAPALPGIHVKIDALTLTSDANGIVEFTQEHNFDEHSITLLDTAIDRPGVRFRFSRWTGQRDPDQAFRPTVSGLPLRANYTVTAAFSTSYPVTVRVLDNAKKPIAASRVSGIVIKGSGGEVVGVPPSGQLWVDGRLPVFDHSRLVQRPVTYSLSHLAVDGSDAVPAGTARFDPAKGQDVTFTVPLFTTTIIAHDALFGGHPGRAVQVTYPNGSVRTFPLGDAGDVTLTGLPRGKYDMTLKGAKGVAFNQTIALSRDKTVTMKVVSGWDLGVIMLALLVVAAIVLLVGQPRLRRVAADGVRSVKSLRSQTWLRPGSGGSAS